MLTAILVIAAITQILVSLFVFIRGRRNLSFFLFFLIGLTLASWAITNYLTVVLLGSSNLIYVVRSILFFVVLQNSFFYMFGRIFPESRWKFSKRWLSVYVLFSIFVASLTLSPYVFTAVKIEDGLPVTQVGPGILAFIIHASFSIGYAFKSLIKKIKQSSGPQKNQLRILVSASFLVWVVVPITNFVITPLFKTTFFIVISPIYTLVFASIIAYAIVAHKLFDIKAIVARSVAYVLSLGFLALIYTTSLSLIQNKTFPLFSSNELTLIVNAAFFLCAVVLYPYIKNFFDRFTNKLFYQDAYEPQKFLEQLNRVLVSEVDLQPLLKDVANIIEQNIKVEYCTFLLRETAYFSERAIGTKSIKIQNEDIEIIKQESPKIHHRIIITDELGTENVKLKMALERQNIAVVARLVTTVKYEIEGVGFLVMGPKKSGNPYNAQDNNMFHIVANELVITIQNALRFEEIEEFNTTLQTKIDDATKELRKTNEKLKQLDEAKDEFISMASHQLRTPLTSVKGYLSMVLEGDAGEIQPMQRKLLDQAFTSSQRMVYLIADLLNVSRLRTGKFVIEPIMSNLADVVEGEIGQLKETAEGRGLALTYNKPEAFPALYIDETKIRQVIMNFIDNAIYYTPKGGHIDVKLEDKDQSVELTVNDNGMGVPKGEQQHLFTKFYRAENAQKARPDGTGLGLFMAKKVIVAQGGSLIFNSQEGKGSTFGFNFPKAKLLPPVTSDNVSETAIN